MGCSFALACCFPVFGFKPSFERWWTIAFSLFQKILLLKTCFKSIVVYFLRFFHLIYISLTHFPCYYDGIYEPSGDHTTSCTFLFFSRKRFLIRRVLKKPFLNGWYQFNFPPFDENTQCLLVSSSNFHFEFKP